jgi:predicted transcriptional regulator
MRTVDDWQLAVAETVQTILQQGEIRAPPVDALALAHSLHLTIAWDRTQTGRGRLKRIAGRSTIFLRPEERPERLQWAAAHEVGESLIWQICRSLDVDGAELSPRQREALANRFARELLLPLEWFRRDCQSFQFDLAALKARYHTVSHELIAWRFLDLEAPGVVTVFDQGALTRRQGNGPMRTPPLTDVERRCWEWLRRTRDSALIQDPRLTVRGWCIDSPGWEREILYAVYAETADD